MIRIIVAINKNFTIGDKGEIPWNLPEDLKTFKSKTMGQHVIMGRKTWESLPPKKLPGRRVIVITSDENYEHDEIFDVVSSPEEALNKYYDVGFWVAGGASIYDFFLPYAHQLHITEVLNNNVDGDSKFSKELLNDWTMHSHVSDADWVGNTHVNHILTRV